MPNDVEQIVEKCIADMDKYIFKDMNEAEIKKLLHAALTEATAPLQKRIEVIGDRNEFLEDVNEKLQIENCSLYERIEKLKIYRQ